MEKIFIEKTLRTPEIILDKEKGIFSIKGKSLPEDTLTFYESVFEFFKEYVKSPNSTTQVEFNLEYFNTSSSKAFATILKTLQPLNENLVIDWYYEAEDEDMFEAGEDFQSITGLNFKFIQY